MESSPARSGCSASSSTSTPEPFSSSYKPGQRLAFQKELCDVNTYEPVAEDVRHGYKVLQQLMAPALKRVNAVFMLDLGPDDQGSIFHTPGTRCFSLPEMKEMFEASAYTSLTDFVKDVRDMFIAHIRYNGPEHANAAKCEKLETIMQQRIALLPRKYKEMCSLENTHMSHVKTPDWSTRSTRNVTHNLSGALIHQLQQEAKKHEKEVKRKQYFQREKEKESLKHDLACWETELFADKKLEQMLSSWELPQIGLFLYLCQTPLNCGPISQCEVERMILLCKESKAMALVMTSLLSSPHQRQYQICCSLDRRPPMPYHVWSLKLNVRLQSWYKILSDCEGDHNAASGNIGIEPMFWDVVGRLRNPLVHKGFHELTFYQRIWIVKSLCEACVSCQSNLREAIESQASDDSSAYTLGTDSSGTVYINFPQFCGDNLRIYRMKTRKKAGRKRADQQEFHSPHKLSNRSTTPIDVCSVPSNDTLPNSTSVSKQTSSSTSSRAERLARRSAKFEDWRDFKLLESSALLPTSTGGKHITSTTSTTDTTSTDACVTVKTSTTSATIKVTKPINATPSYEAGNAPITEVNSVERELSCVCSTSAPANDNADGCGDCSCQPSSNNHSVDCTQLHATTDQSKSCSIISQDRPGLTCEEGISESSSERVMDKENVNGKNMAVEESQKKENAIKVGVPSVEEPQPEEEEGLITDPPDTHTYRLICQSIEELRELCNRFSVGRGKEVELYEELTRLLSDLTPYDYKLQLVHTKCKESMKREQDRYVEPNPQAVAEVNGAWDTEGEEDEDGACSQSDVASNADENECHIDRTDHEYFAPFREKKVEPPVAKENISAEMGLSLFGRRRKRRLIPNNAETEVFSKKKKKVKQAAPVVTTSADSTTAAASEPAETKQSTPAAASVPEGYTMVKINKQLYLVPNDQLPSLLTQTHSTKVQVVTQAVKLVNPNAVKTLHAMNTLTGVKAPQTKQPVKLHSLPRTRIELPTNGHTALKAAVSHSSGKSSTSVVALASKGQTTPTSTTHTAVARKQTALSGDVSINTSTVDVGSSSMKFTTPLTVSSDPLGLSKRGVARCSANQKLSSLDTTTHADTSVAAQGPGLVTHPATLNTQQKEKATTTDSMNCVASVQTYKPATILHSKPDGPQANTESPRIIYPLQCTDRVKGQAQKLLTSNEHLVKLPTKRRHSFADVNQSDTINSRTLTNSIPESAETKASRVIMELPSATIQVPSSMVVNLLSFAGNAPVTISATPSIAARTAATSAITRAARAGCIASTCVNTSPLVYTIAHPSAPTNTAQSLPITHSSATGTVPKHDGSVGSSPTVTTAVTSQPTITTAITSLYTLTSPDGLTTQVSSTAPKPVMVSSTTGAVWQQVGNGSRVRPLTVVPGVSGLVVQPGAASRISQPVVLSTSSAALNSAVSLPFSAQQARRAATPTQVLVRGQTPIVLQHVAGRPGRPRIPTAGSIQHIRPVLMQTRPRVQLISSAPVMTLARGPVNSSLKSPTVVTVAASASTQVLMPPVFNTTPRMLRSRSKVTTIGDISLVRANVRPANQQRGLRLNTPSSISRASAPAQLISPAQNGSIVIRKVVPKANANSGVIRLTTTNHLGQGTNKLVVLKNSNGTYYVPPELKLSKGLQPTQTAIPFSISAARSTVSAEAVVAKECNKTAGDTTSNTHLP